MNGIVFLFLQFDILTIYIFLKKINLKKRNLRINCLYNNRRIFMEELFEEIIYQAIKKM